MLAAHPRLPSLPHRSRVTIPCIFVIGYAVFNFYFLVQGQPSLDAAFFAKMGRMLSLWRFRRGIAAVPHSEVGGRGRPSASKCQCVRCRSRSDGQPAASPHGTLPGGRTSGQRMSSAR